MFRNAVAIVAGLAGAVFLIFIVQKVGHVLFPPPAGLDINDVQAARNYVAQLPLLALLFPVFSYGIGAFCGSLIACTIGTARPMILGGIVGLIILAMTIGNLIWIPHPHWFSALAIAVVVGGAWLAAKLSPRSESATPTEPSES